MARSDFITQLQALGYNVEDKGGNRLAFRYIIPLGRYAGQDIWLGFEVGEDFPATPPGGPHVSPRLLPLNNTQGVPHPIGAIHESTFGEGWEYWSRPFPVWPDTDRTVIAYMRHIRRLFDTQ